MRYKSGEVDDVDDYLRYLDEQGCDRIFFDSLIRRDDLELVRDRLDEYLQKTMENPNIREDLQIYVNELGDDKDSIEEVLRVFEQTEHRPFIWDICKHLVLNPSTKTNSVFIYGAPNTGKTQFLNRLSEVFDLIYFKQTRSHFDCRYKQGKRHPHFVVCEEGCFNRLFDHRDQYQNAKLAFEGQGMIVEQKQKHPKEFFKGVPFILTANKLPSVLREPLKKDGEDLWSWNERFDNYKTLMTRSRVHEMRQSKKVWQKFPYTAKQLAIYMNHICDSIRPEIDSEPEEPFEQIHDPNARGRMSFIEAMDQGLPIAPPPHILQRNPTFNINKIFNSIQPTAQQLEMRQDQLFSQYSQSQIILNQINQNLTQNNVPTQRRQSLDSMPNVDLEDMIGQVDPENMFESDDMSSIASGPLGFTKRNCIDSDRQEIVKINRRSNRIKKKVEEA